MRNIDTTRVFLYIGFICLMIIAGVGLFKSGNEGGIWFLIFTIGGVGAAAIASHKIGIDYVERMNMEEDLDMMFQESQNHQPPRQLTFETIPVKCDICENEFTFEKPMEIKMDVQCPKCRQVVKIDED